MCSPHCPLWYRNGPYSVVAISSYTTAIARTLGSWSQHHSTPLAILFSADVENLDPYTHVFVQRIKTFTRFFTKWPSYRGKLDVVLQYYYSNGLQGVYNEQQLQPGICPLPGQPGREWWTGGLSPMGPVGFLVKQISMMGATLDHSAYTIRSRILPDYHLLHYSFDAGIEMSTRLANHCVCYQAIQLRTLLHKCRGIDLDIYHAARTKMTTQHNNVIHAISSFSVIDNDYLVRIGALSKSGCSFCDSEDGSLWHCCYECTHPELHRVRSQHNDDALQLMILDNAHRLPRHLLMGIPDLLHPSPLQPFWGDDEFVLSDYDNKTLELIGYQSHFKEDQTGFVESCNLQHATYALILFARHSGADIYPDDMPDPGYIAECAPQHVTVHTDGGMLHPDLPCFGVLSFGINWLYRTYQDITHYELEYAHCEEQDGTLVCMGCQPSLVMSSTRSELMAVVFAIHIPQAMHIMLDNLNVVRKASWIINWVSKSQRPIPERFISLSKNGDLWAIFYRVLKSRGSHSLLVSKTIGHASKKVNFSERPDLYEDAMHNKKADWLATRARKLYLSRFVFDLSCHLVNRHRNYVKLLGAIHTLIVRMYLAIDQLRNSSVYKLQQSTTLAMDSSPGNDNMLMSTSRYPFVPSELYGDCHSFYIKLKVNDWLVGQYLAGAPIIMKGFWNVLIKHRLHKPTNASGCTWIHWFFLALGHTPDPLARTHGRTARTRWNLSRHIRHFRTECLKLLNFVTTPAYMRLFHASTYGPNRLTRYGFNNHWLHTCVVPVLPSEVNSMMDKCFLNVLKPLSRIQNNALAADELFVQSVKLTGRGTIRCSTQLRQLRVRVLQHCNDIQASVISLM